MRSTPLGFFLFWVRFWVRVATLPQKLHRIKRFLMKWKVHQMLYRQE